jgi:hypothetical protein
MLGRSYVLFYALVLVSHKNRPGTGYQHRHVHDFHSVRLQRYAL